MLGVPSWISGPTWSPDGKEVAFIRNRSIEIIKIDGRSHFTHVSEKAREPELPCDVPSGLGKTLPTALVPLM